MTPHPLDSSHGIQFRFAVHRDLAALGTITMRARIGDRELGEQTFQGEGEHVYSAALPYPVETVGALRIHFALDRAYVPAPPDRRELGLQVTFEKMGLTPKREFTHPIVLG
jgi:hypothetical protein